MNMHGNVCEVADYKKLILSRQPKCRDIVQVTVRRYVWYV